MEPRLCPPHPHLVLSHGVIHQLKGTEGPGSGDPPPRGPRLSLSPAPAPRGWGARCRGGEAAAVCALPVPWLCPACPARPTCPTCALPVPFPFYLPASPYLRRCQAPALAPTPAPAPAPARSDGSGRSRREGKTPAERKRLRLAPPVPTRPAGDGRGGEEGEGDRRKGKEGKGRHGKMFFLHQDKIRTHFISSHPERGSTGGDHLELNPKVAGRDRGDSSLHSP